MPRNTKSRKPAPVADKPAPVAEKPADKPAPELPAVTLPEGMTWEQAAEAARLNLKAIKRAARKARTTEARSLSTGEYAGIIRSAINEALNTIFQLPSAEGKVLRALSVKATTGKDDNGQSVIVIDVKRLSIVKPRAGE